METAARARKIRLMAFDVDGVMTDGSIYYTDEGTELKAFNALDGAGLKMLEKAGIAVAIVTGRKAPCVALRARNLGIERLYQGVHDKVACVQTLLAELGLEADAAGFMGDDVMDLGVMAHCGFSAAPANARCPRTTSATTSSSPSPPPPMEPRARPSTPPTSSSASTPEPQRRTSR